MVWWQILTTVLLGLLAIVLIIISARMSMKGSPLETKRLRRGIDKYMAVWTVALMCVAAFVIVGDWWISPFMGIAVGALIAIMGLLRIINSTRYLLDSINPLKKNDSELLKGYKEIEATQGLMSLAISAGIFALTALLWNMQRLVR